MKHVQCITNWTVGKLMGNIIKSAQQIDSMLPCICLVRDHRWFQNVLRTKSV